MDELYPSQYEEWITLKDGNRVFLRPVKTTDGDLLQELFRKLSPFSIRLRFLSPLESLPENILYQFTHLDYKKNFGLAALTDIENSGPIIGVGRYAYDSQSEKPELAVAVRDDWQGKGLGTILFMRVIKIGVENGYPCFGAVVDPQNRTMMNIFRRSGYPYKISSGELGAYIIEIQGGEKR